MNNNRYGILLIDKNKGFTSSDTVRMLARRLGVRKAGHTGTLDKFASGLLVCLAGTFTRLAPYLVDQGKGYEAVIEFGKETETLDPEGKITATSEVPSPGNLNAALNLFRGTIEQRPPLFSAVHIDGTRAYRRALKGEDVEMPVRQVTIDTLELIEYRAPFATIRVDCSKGTYIRSLARDIARSAGSVGYLHSLRRTRVGDALVADGLDPQKADSETPLLNDRGTLQRILGVDGITIPGNRVDSFLDGQHLDEEFLSGELHRDHLICFDPQDQFLGVLKRSGAGFRYGMVNGALRD